MTSAPATRLGLKGKDCCGGGWTPTWSSSIPRPRDAATFAEPHRRRRGQARHRGWHPHRAGRRAHREQGRTRPAPGLSALPTHKGTRDARHTWHPHPRAARWPRWPARRRAGARRLRADHRRGRSQRRESAGARPGSAPCPQRTVRFTFFGSAEEKPVWDKISEQFGARTPGVQVIPEHVPAQYFTKITAASLGDSADVILMEDKPTSGYAKQGYFRELDGFIGTDRTFKYEDYYPGLFEGLKFRGKLTGCPSTG